MSLEEAIAELDTPLEMVSLAADYLFTIRQHVRPAPFWIGAKFV